MSTDSPQVLKQSTPEFSFDNYRFFTYDQSEYLQTFIKQEKVNEFEIRKQLTQMVYIQVIGRLN